MYSFELVSDLAQVSVDEPVFLDVTSSDDAMHAAVSVNSLLYLRTLNSKKTYVFPFLHNEFSFSLDSLVVAEFLRNLKVKKYVWDKKVFLHHFYDDSAIELRLLQFYGKGEVTEDSVFDTTAHKTIKHRCFTLEGINLSIPVLKHVERSQNRFEEASVILKKYESDFSENVNYDFLRQLFHIETLGLKVDRDLMLEHWPQSEKHISKKGYVYGEYNICTVTGRPSNRFGGINYAALNNEKKEREPFVSRFDKGRLVYFDYSAFHPRLITSLIDYTIPYSADVYEYLGKFYFKKDSLTKDEMDESKKLTFKLLYGGITQEYMHIEYFKRIHNFSENLWKFFHDKGYIETPLFGRKIKKLHIKEPFPSKVFNYLLQSYESEVGSLVIGNLQNYLSDKNTKLVMYQYDGFLFDFDLKDGKEVLLGIKDILVMNNKLPIKVKAGVNFQDIVEIKV